MICQLERKRPWRSCLQVSRIILSSSSSPEDECCHLFEKMQRGNERHELFRNTRESIIWKDDEALGQIHAFRLDLYTQRAHSR